MMLSRVEARAETFALVSRPSASPMAVNTINIRDDVALRCKSPLLETWLIGHGINPYKNLYDKTDFGMVSLELDCNYRCRTLQSLSK
jgi:hypothetical protein